VYILDTGDTVVNTIGNNSCLPSVLVRKAKYMSKTSGKQDGEKYYGEK
jgi:hypothetical protein